MTNNTTTQRSDEEIVEAFKNAYIDTDYLGNAYEELDYDVNLGEHITGFLRQALSQARKDTEERMRDKILEHIDEEIKKQKDSFGVRSTGHEVCWTCYKAGFCPHEITIDALKEVKEFITN